MAYLVFCDFDVGGLPTRMAEILNASGIEAFLVNTSKQVGHDSASYHFGDKRHSFNITSELPDIEDEGAFITALARLKKEYGITQSFATGVSSWMLQAAGIPYNYWAYGSDVDVYASDLPYTRWGIIKALAPKKRWSELERIYNKEIVTMPNWRLFHEYIKKTLRKCRKLMLAPYQKPAARMVAGFWRPFLLPHLLQSITDVELKKLETEPIAALKGRPYVVSATRHVWRGFSSVSTDNKGNDVAIKGFAHYLAKSGNSDICLVLINKGINVPDSKKLAESLNISDRLVWIDEMPRPSLAGVYAGAQAALGNFFVPVITGTVVEPISFGVPCVSYYLKTYPQDPPVLNGRTPQQIGELLWDILHIPGRRQHLSQAGLNWVKNTCTEKHFISALTNSFN